ncbi:MAG: TolC family protein, partial [Ginsengibacter sp.]
SFDIPVFNRNQGIIAIAKATREQLNLEYQARLHQAQADIAALVADLQLISQTEQILETALPRTRHAEQVMAEGLKTGDITEIAYQSVRADLFNKELRLLVLKQNRAEQMIALQIALGRLWNEAPAHVTK